MTMNDRKKRLLSVLTMGSKRLQDFTGGRIADSCSPYVISNHLTALCDAGYVVLTGDRYAITPEGEAALAEKPSVTPGTMWCNASTPPGSLKLRTWQTRTDGAPRVGSRGWA